MANLSQLLPITNNLVTQTDLTTSLASKVTGAAATSSVGGDLKLYEATANGTNYVSFKAPNTLAGNVTWVLPSADGTNGQVLSTNGSGTLAWTTASSSQWTTSGSNIYYTAGNVGIGTTTPNYLLTFANTASRSAAIHYTSADPNTFLDIISGGISGGWLGGIRFFTSASAGTSERARITSAGDVAIGSTTASGSKLYVQGVAQATGGVQDSAIEALLDDDGSYGKTGTRAAIKAVTFGVGRGATPYGLWVSCTEIDSGTCIGAYNLASGIYGTQTATLSEVSKNLGAYGGGYCHYAKATTTGSGGTVNLYFGEHNGTTRYIVYLNGGIANYQANNVNLSDRREKTDFAPAKNYLDTICAIPVQTFKYIDQTDDAPTLGVVAQDVQTVAPELVCESDWASEGEEKKMRLSIYQTDLQYALMKCIQELNAKVEALTTELNALKGK